jgi:hypothetical protein
VKILPSSYDKLYARWYQKWEADYDFSVLNHGGGFHAGDRNLMGQSDRRPDGTDWFSSWFEPDAGHAATQNGRGKFYSYYRGMYQQCPGQTPGPQAGCWGDSFPTPQERAYIQPPQYQPNRWYCIEIMLDAGTPVASQAQANGSQTFWVDGVQYGPWTNMWFRTSPNLKIGILWLSLFHHDTHSVGGTIFDDVVVSTTRVGCHGTGGGGQTPPNAPTNLRIIPNA